MKRLLLWICLLIPGFALAQPESMPYTTEVLPTYGSMSAEQQRLFDIIYDALWMGETDIKLPQSVLYDDAAFALKTIRRECAELCLAKDGYSILYYREKPEYAVSVTAPASIYLQRDFVQDVIGKMQTEKICSPEQIHTWLCETLTYDAALAGDADIPCSAWISGKAKCGGYAGLFALMCRLQSIPCAVVEGFAYTGQQWEPHAWNIVTTEDGTELLVDVTWDDQPDAWTDTYYMKQLDACADHVPEK